MNYDHKTILNLLHSLGFTEKFGAWEPHELNENNKGIATQYPARHRTTRDQKQRFSNQIVTGDEKSCLYINMKQKRSRWLQEIRQNRESSRNFIQRISWYDFDGTGTTWSNHTPSRQRQAPCCTSRQSRTPRARMGGPVLQHPPYSTDLAPIDYHLFRYLSNHIKGVTINNKYVLKKLAHQLLWHQTRRFLAERHIIKVVKRWEEVFNSNGEYVIN